MAESPSKDPTQIRRMFGSIADRYDLLNRVLSLSIDRYWRRKMVSCVDDGPVLDVACGTGDVMKRLLDRDVEPVIGLDFSEPMLRRGRKKLAEGHVHKQVPFLQGTAEALPVKQSTINYVTCAFGVRNFDDRPACFEEFSRVLKQDGRAVILEFFPPDERWYLKPYHFYLRSILPRIGQWVSGSDEAYDYLKNSVESFASRQDVKQELLSAGFSEVQLIDVSFGIATIIVADQM